MCNFLYNDAGEEIKKAYRDSGYRAISIATKKPYYEIVMGIQELSKKEKITKNQQYKSSLRNGIRDKTFHKYMLSIGWKWISMMKIGTGCLTHLDKKELPKGVLIAKISGDHVAVIDGVINHIYDPNECRTLFNKERETKRCVYGIYVESNRFG